MGLTEKRARKSPAVLTLGEAAWASGLSRATLEACIRDGRLGVRRVVRRGRVVSCVALTELEELHASEVDAAAARAADDRRVRDRVQRLEGELATSERVERALQRYADRLEDRSARREAALTAQLAESRKRELTLARALGQAEARVAQLEGGASGGRRRVAQRSVREGRTVERG